MLTDFTFYKLTTYSTLKKMCPGRTLYFRKGQILNVFAELCLCTWYKGEICKSITVISRSRFQVTRKWMYSMKKVKNILSFLLKAALSICNNSIRFFQCSGCFDIDTLSKFKCGYFKAHSVSSVWKSPIIILSISVSSHCSHSNTLTSADAYVHTDTQSAHTWLISVQCQWF